MKKRGHTHRLDMEDRMVIQACIAKGDGLGQIAARLKANKSTVPGEIARGSTVVPGLSDIRVLVGRTYSDFLERREARPGECLVQLDSVIGKASGRRAILPITLPKYGFQFGRIVGKGRPAFPSPGSFPWGARGVKLGRFQRNARTRTASERSWSAPPRWVPGVTWQKNARAFLDFLNIPKFRRFLKGFLE